MIHDCPNTAELKLRKAIVAHAYTLFRNAELVAWQLERIGMYQREAITQNQYEQELLTKKIHPCHSLFTFASDEPLFPEQKPGC